ncbi:MAG TPA: GNAT family N-acetyltransferase [Actinomycetota bacterium]|nr:GNAT family N-acetyltransferase [Actinomycetota bacterium]
MVPAPAFETSRLRLREMTTADLDALHRVLGDPETMSFYDHPFSIDETRRWIEWSLDNYERHGFGLWAMTLKGSGELIGDCGLTVQHVDGADFVEVGWHTRRDLWGRGFASEAAAASRDRGFDDFGLDVLVSLVDTANRASCRVAEKIGMTLWKDTVRADGDVRHVYRIRKDER